MALIDLTTGIYHPLPNLVRQNLVYFNAIAWKPNSMIVAVGLGDPNPAFGGAAKAYLLDLGHDTATALPANQLPQRWTPDGKTLVMSTGTSSDAGSQPWDLNAVTFSSSGHQTVTLLTHNALYFDFVGFIRSA